MKFYLQLEKEGKEWGDCAYGTRKLKLNYTQY